MKLQTVLMLSDGVYWLWATIITEGRSRWLGRPYRVAAVVVVVVVVSGGGGKNSQDSCLGWKMGNPGALLAISVNKPFRNYQ